MEEVVQAVAGTEGLSETEILLNETEKFKNIHEQNAEAENIEKQSRGGNFIPAIKAHIKEIIQMPSVASVTKNLSGVFITSAILPADAAHFVYITNIRDIAIIDIEISVKYCINAITDAVADVPLFTLKAARATTPAIPRFISKVIIGLTEPIIIPALLSFLVSI